MGQAIPEAVERSIDLLTSDTFLIAIRLQRVPVEAYPLLSKIVYLGERNGSSLRGDA